MRNGCYPCKKDHRRPAQPTPASLASTAVDGDAPLHAWLEQAWSQGNHAGFLSQGLPLARELLQRQAAAGTRTIALDAQQVLLLSRCAQALAPGGDAEGWQCCELAAHGGDRTAQLELGLGYARMDAHGQRLATRNGAANFKRAVRWLTQAGEQGLAEAWFVLSRIYTKPEFSQRNVVEAHSCLERAADLGHGPAQLECGMHAWRNRRDGVNNDVRAAYWLLQAQAQGSSEAEAALAKIAPQGEPGDWGQCAAMHADGHLRQLGQSHPLLAARLALARCFHLSRAEALAARYPCGRPGALPVDRYQRHAWARQAAPGADPHGAGAPVARPGGAPVRARRLRRGRVRKAITGSVCTA